MSLDVYALFHLNLAFSSIEEETRPEVIKRCYWPLLHLAETHGFPLAIEATSFTLSTIDSLDPAWVPALRRLVEAGKIEFVGSGLAQIIGPLVPASVNRANLRLGHDAYEKLLGLRPTLALVNEQAYAGGLVPLYAEAGYRALVMDYDNCAHHHRDWPRALRYAPQRVRGADGTVLDLIWTNTIAFQKAQRLAHGDLAPVDYLAYVASQVGAEPRAFALYGNDAEIFDFRPGRLATEPKLSRESEWWRLTIGLGAVRDWPDVHFRLPSALLARDWPHRAAAPLVLETAAHPIPVKKQHKYNITRWAVSGRDDLDINTRCHRLARALERSDADDAAWRELALLWSSDFRTHITAKRWAGYQARLSAFEDKMLAAHPSRRPSKGPPQDEVDVCLSPSQPHPEEQPKAASRRMGNTKHISEDNGLIKVETPAVRARFNVRRGLALASASFAEPDGAMGPPLCGTLPHGHFDDVLLAFDWYSGSLIYDRPAAPKITDLSPATPDIVHEDGAVTLDATLATPLGPVRKRITIAADAPRIDYELTLDWTAWGAAALRLGNFTLMPETFSAATLRLRTQNGGDVIETFALAPYLNRKGPIDHGAPVSLQVSAGCGLGLTGGWAEIGDERRRLRISVDHTAAALIGMLTLRAVNETYLCRLSLSGLEYDETRRPAPENVRPRTFRFSIGLAEG